MVKIQIRERSSSGSKGARNGSEWKNHTSTATVAVLRGRKWKYASIKAILKLVFVRPVDPESRASNTTDSAVQIIQAFRVDRVMRGQTVSTKEQKQGHDNRFVPDSSKSSRRKNAKNMLKTEEIRWGRETEAKESEPIIFRKAGLPIIA